MSQRLELSAIMQNLHELDMISRAVSNEFERRNRLLGAAVNNCQTCRSLASRNRQKK